MKVNESSYIFLVLYVDDIVLSSNDSDLLVRQRVSYLVILMNDLGDASYILGIQILHDRGNSVLSLWWLSSEYTNLKTLLIIIKLI